MQPNPAVQAQIMEIVSSEMSSSMNPEGISPSQSARIEVIGVGGGGSNAVNRMILSDLEGVAYRVLNTDAQALIQSAADNRVQLGKPSPVDLELAAIPALAKKQQKNRGLIFNRRCKVLIWSSLPRAWEVAPELVQLPLSPK